MPPFGVVNVLHFREKKIMKKTYAHKILAKIISGVCLMSGAYAASAIDADFLPHIMNDSGETNQLIVKFKDNSSTSALSVALKDRLQAKRLELRQKISAFFTQKGVKFEHARWLNSGAELISLSQLLSEAEVQLAITELQNDPNVEYVTRDAMMYPLATPNDTLFGTQWHYGAPEDGGIGVEAAWDITTGTGATVAVLDTGALYNHPDLSANLLPGYDMISDLDIAQDGDGRDSDASDIGDWGCPSNNRPSSWHGSHVAGTVAAVTNNGSGVAGVAYGAKVLPVRVLGRCGGLLSDITDGILYAAGVEEPGIPTNDNPAQVINMSLGGSGSCDPAYQEAIDRAVDAGVTVVVAAGNSSADAEDFRPASCDNVISVAASEPDRSLAPYTNYGSKIDVVAPGGGRGTDGVLSTVNESDNTPDPDGYGYDYAAGTSMAAPHVAGVAALMYSVKPDITPAQVEQLITENTSPVGELTVERCTIFFGFRFCNGERSVSLPEGTGILNAEAAVKAAQAL